MDIFTLLGRPLPTRAIKNMTSANFSFSEPDSAAAAAAALKYNNTSRAGKSQGGYQAWR